MFRQTNTMEHKLNEACRTLESESLRWKGMLIERILLIRRMPEPLIRAGGILKQAAAIVNAEVLLLVYIN